MPFNEAKKVEDSLALFPSIDEDLSSISVIAASTTKPNKKNPTTRFKTISLYMMLACFCLSGFIGGIYLYSPNKTVSLTKNAITSIHEVITGQNIISAINTGDLELLKTELDRGIDANTTDFMGVSALTIAYENGGNLMILALLEAGADPNSNAIDGTPLILGFTMQNNYSLVENLIGFGADVNAAPSENPCSTAFSWATKNHLDDIKTLLVQNGVSQNIDGACGENPIAIAIDEPPVSGLENAIKTPLQDSDPIPVLNNLPEPNDPPVISEPVLAQQVSNQENALGFQNNIQIKETIVNSIQRAYQNDR